MVSIILAAHGRLAVELLNSAEMIFGKQENIATVTFLPGENTTNLKEKYKECLKKLTNSKEVLFIVDLFGGSPYNAAFEVAMANENMDVLTGASLPMLLEVLSERNDENVTIQNIIETIDAAKSKFICCCKQLQSCIEEEEL